MNSKPCQIVILTALLPCIFQGVLKNRAVRKFIHFSPYLLFYPSPPRAAIHIERTLQKNPPFLGLDRDQRARPIRLLGSKMSRSPSPRKLNDKMVRKIASDGNRIRCG